MFDVDVKGGVNLKRIFRRAGAVGIRHAAVGRRTATASKDAAPTRPKRSPAAWRKAEQELAFAPQFDRVVVNDCLLPLSPRRSGSPKRSSDNGPFHAGGNDTLFRVVQPRCTGGHVAVADAVLESTGAEALWFVVSPQNPFKAGKELAPKPTGSKWRASRCKAPFIATA